MPRERKCFTGSYDDGRGARVDFRLWAYDWADAEAAVERIGVSGVIDGELIEEGECDFLQVGNA
jgi:hypothetical protein